ncbi:AraC family ligand binding domain-containing protein [Oceanicoccus sp. KOV_DT_Chl]|uniref:AraC family ligand binding domain-containing protein n=1 Tax=Oceanicoccus sp. KOV_DT_Chl TaxID=1904639 RepID=UPI000C7D1A37
MIIRCAAHQKNGWTLHLTTKGSGRYNCVRQTLDSRVGSLMLFNPDAYFDHRRNPTVTSGNIFGCCFKSTMNGCIY